MDAFNNLAGRTRQGLCGGGRQSAQAGPALVCGDEGIAKVAERLIILLDLSKVLSLQEQAQAQLQASAA